MGVGCGWVGGVGELCVFVCVGVCVGVGLCACMCSWGGGVADWGAEHAHGEAFFRTSAQVPPQPPQPPSLAHIWKA